MQEIILMSDPRVAAVPVEECGEPLVDLREIPGVRIDERLADAEGAYTRIRLGVAERVATAQKRLPGGLRFLVVEGYRPLSLQIRYFDEYAAELRAANPEWSEEHLYVQASRSLAPPAVGPHVCGGAIDLTLCTSEGRELPMGTEVNASPEESANACYTNAPGLSPSARSNRTILATALSSAGLVNYPTEWWHWSYGDRYWATLSGAQSALYSPLEWP
ncbi:D-alanyl-D-alanine dipeptidase [Acrocarpospora phusangensis]|uniref:D-alanyl-D-alanine dipeptidase n=1 Tax=Acrocarpospora phusangensis TaxID=1070424 RepID=A0A919UTK4_9ACTN|nr:M15 family metallopeptidase [Acrocarpospora phusangensis]GIH27500.1 D-alanyl-D-alanine dipeptidase [Acrocarpospora phusangensis]